MTHPFKIAELARSLLYMSYLLRQLLTLAPHIADPCIAGSAGAVYYWSEFALNNLGPLLGGLSNFYRATQLC